MSRIRVPGGISTRPCVANDAWSEEVRRQLCAALRGNAPAGADTERHLRTLITGTAANPGKLIRARLVVATLAAHGIDRSAQLPLATAVEYFHVASLLLDDLPCMDDAETRRGRPCAHRVHGEASAILAALAFINRAYALAGLALLRQPPGVRLQAQVCLDGCLGAAGLVGGQARDLRFADSDGSAREVGRIGLGKTAALFRLGLLLPALLARPSPDELRRIKALCVYWGLAFQALDDLHDLTATSVDAGKTTGRDRELIRPNLALAVGVPATRARVRRLLAHTGHCIERLTAARPQWSYLDQFQHYFASLAAPLAAASREIAA